LKVFKQIKGIDKMSTQKMKHTAVDMLENNIIPFWKGLCDDEFGGFYGFMDSDLQLNKKADKNCILTSRILWFFSETARVLQRPDLLDYAEHTYRFLVDHCCDKEHGGVFWSVTYDGKPKDTIKHSYNQAFAIYALSAFYEASGNRDALDMAFDIFNTIETKCKEHNGYGEAYDRAFVLIGNDKLSENDVLAERTMNTFLHVFEAYSGLYRATKSDDVKKAMYLMLDTYTENIYNPNEKRLDVFFDADWNSLVDMTSYGHDIEATWLVEWGCKMLDDPSIMKKVEDINSKIISNVYDKGYKEGSLRYECVNGIENEKRDWWVQAEAVVGFLSMARKHPDQPKYLKAAEDIMDFIENKVVDKRPGSEWLGSLLPDGSLPERRRPMVDGWKCPYHNGRMCLEIIKSNGGI